MRKAKIFAGAAVLALGGSLAVAAPAVAYVDGGYSGSNVRIRQTPNTSDTRVLGLGQTSHTARLWCFTPGSTVSGDPWWDYHTNRNTGKVGYSSETLLWGNIQTEC
ncbi:hypothetical protein [Actinoplanes sp. NPDC049802]|uniref:hypothetical protein n=1 Tax=Actinoplanes sp. NPDC049802 TaxID=3154742 RepID=UPI0033DF44A1